MNCWSKKSQPEERRRRTTTTTTRNHGATIPCPVIDSFHYLTCFLLRHKEEEEECNEL
jgi:hypothetical protein